MTTSTPYTPSTGLARSVIEFFVSNRDEVLDMNDLVSKFSASKASIPALLKRARECGAIVYNGGLYMLGDFKTAQQCLQPLTTDTPTPLPATVAAPEPAALQPDAQPKPPKRGLNRSSITIPGIGAITITHEPLASRIPVTGYKWDPLLDGLAGAPISVVEGELATVRLPKAMAGAVKSGIESWHKRHADLPFPCRFRASVSGDQVLVQRIA